MSWFKADDGFPEHPKFEALEGEGPAAYMAALTVWIVMGADCSRRLTDGFVSSARLQKVLGHLGKSAKRGAEALVRVKLWTVEEDGYRFHDWCDYQPSREKVLADRDAKKERQNRWKSGRGDAKGDASPSMSADTPEDANGDASPDALGVHAHARVLPSRPVPSRPDQLGEKSPSSRPRSEPSASANAEWDMILGTVCLERQRAKPVVTPSQSWQIAGRVRDIATTHGVSFAEAARKLAGAGLDAPAGKFAWTCLEADPYVRQPESARRGGFAPVSTDFGPPTDIDEAFGPDSPNASSEASRDDVRTWEATVNEFYARRGRTAPQPSPSQTLTIVKHIANVARVHQRPFEEAAERMADAAFHAPPGSSKFPFYCAEHDPFAHAPNGKPHVIIRVPKDPWV